MRQKNLLEKAAITSAICICAFMILAIVWPISASADTVALDDPTANCLSSQLVVELGWQSDISGTVDFHILRKADGETSYTELNAIQEKTYIDSSPVSGVRYFYKIRATRGVDEFFSNEVTLSATYCSAVLAPPSALCQADGPHIVLGWSQASGSLSTYEIYRDGTKISTTTNLSYTDGPDITGTTSYDYSIRTVWANGEYRDSDAISINAPACPPTLNVSTACESADPGGPIANLSWNSLLGVQGYQIYRKARAETEFSLLQTLSASDTSFTDRFVDSIPDTYYLGGASVYFLKAVWETDQKDSDSLQIQIPRCAPFLKIMNNCDEFSMRLSWTATTSATHYNIYRDDVFLVQVTGTANISYIDYLNFEACPGQNCSHTYRTEAIVSSFPPFVSNSVSKNIDCSVATPPSPPPDLNTSSSFCVSGDSRVTISWNPSDNVTYYTVYRNDIPIINLLETSYTDSGVEGGYEYTYRVTAFGKNGTYTNSDNSITASATDCITPSTPNLTVTSSCENGRPVNNLSWSESLNSYSYDIYRGLSQTSLSLLTTFSQTSPEFSSRTWKDLNVSASTNYYYKIVAEGPTGATPSSSTIVSTSTSTCIPSAPTLTLTRNCTDNQPAISLSWTDGGANTARYEIFRADLPASPPMKTFYPTDPEFTSRSWTDVIVTQNVSYQYKIDAVGFLSGQRSSQGYKSITAYDCQPPTAALSEPTNLICRSSYPSANIAWSASSQATSFNIYRQKVIPSETTSILNKTSPYSDFTFGNNLKFDGIDDFVDLPASLNNLGDVFTVEGWFYAESASGWPRLVGNWQWNNVSWSVVLNEDRTVCGTVAYTDREYENRADACGLGTATLNTWHHFAFVKTLTQIRLYLDGTGGTPVSTSGTLPLVTRAVYIGRRLDGSSPFKGFIDEIRISNTPLYTSNFTVPIPPLVPNGNTLALYHFDREAGSQTAIDDSFNGYNGRLGATSGIDLTDPTWFKGIECGKQYTWQVEAFAPGGSTLSNITVPINIQYCPPGKSYLIASSLCSVDKPEISLAWTYSINANKFEIYRQGATNPIKTILNTDPEFSTRTWTDDNQGTGLTPGTNYTYWVRAVSPDSSGTDSDSIQISSPYCTTPTSPQNLSAVFACTLVAIPGFPNGYYPQVNLNWDSSQNATYYGVYRNDTFLANSSSNSYIDAYPSSNIDTPYNYYVVAYGPGGASLPSQTVNIRTDYCIPLTPSINDVRTGCAAANKPYAEVWWSNVFPSTKIGYKIYRDTQNEPPIGTTQDPGWEFAAWREWTDTNAAALTNHIYWVKSFTPPGLGPSKESIFSAPRTVTTYSCQVPDAPNLTIHDTCTVDQYNSLALFGWNRALEAKEYRLYKNGSEIFHSIRSIPTDNGFIRDWLLLQPFSYASDQRQTAFNTSYIDELKIKPREGEVTNGKTWGTYHLTSAWTDYISLTDILSPSDNMIIYAFAYVYSPTVKNVQLRVGSDDSIKAFFNGQEVWSNYTSRGANPDQDIVNVQLRAGFNSLLLKIQNNQWGWGFYARFTDASGNNALENITGWDSLASSGTSANYYVATEALGGASSPSNIVSSNPTDCAPAKQTLEIISQCDGSNTQMQLQWSIDAQDMTDYWSVWKKREGETVFTHIADISSPTTSMIDGNVESDVSYEYYLEAIGRGLSTLSDVVSKKASICLDAPTRPIITATPMCYGYSARNAISWGQDLTGRTISFNVWRKNMTLNETNFTQVYGGLAATVTSYADLADEENNYVYKIQAVGSGEGNVVFSDPSPEITTLACSELPPNPPTLSLDFIVSTGDMRAISLYWNDVGNAEKYKLFRRSSPWTEIIELPGESDPTTTLHYIDYALVDGTAYQYQVFAYNANSPLGVASNIVDAPLPISVPGELTLSGDWTSRSNVDLSWTNASTTAAGGSVRYRVIRGFSVNLDSPVTLADNILSTDPLIYTDTNSGYNLYYVVEAINNGGITQSNKIRIPVPLPLWKEVQPE